MFENTFDYEEAAKLYEEACVGDGQAAVRLLDDILMRIRREAKHGEITIQGRNYFLTPNEVQFQVLPITFRERFSAWIEEDRRGLRLTTNKETVKIVLDWLKGRGFNPRLIRRGFAADIEIKWKP